MNKDSQYFVRLECLEKKNPCIPTDKVNAGPYYRSVNEALSTIALDSDKFLSDEDIRPSWDPQHPEPSEEADLRHIWITTKLTKRQYYVCGFRNLKQYKKWFKFEQGRKDIKDIARVAIYRITKQQIDGKPTIAHGVFQSIAHIEALEFVRAIPTDAPGYLGKYLKTNKRKLRNNRKGMRTK